jgi:hypothetical protein
MLLGDEHTGTADRMQAQLENLSLDLPASNPEAIPAAAQGEERESLGGGLAQSGDN